MALLRLYADCIAQTRRALTRSPWTLLLPTAIALLLVPVGMLARSLGFLGGLVQVLAESALLASYLYVLSELVRGSPFRASELKESFRPFFWPIVNVRFVLWIAGFLFATALASRPNADALQLAIWGVVFLLLNAAPEVIYQKGAHGGLETIAASIAFLQQHWVEWLIPNVLFAALLYFGIPWLSAVAPFSLIVLPVVLGLVVHLLAVFRGFLFAALDGTTARQRELRYRLGR